MINQSKEKLLTYSELARDIPVGKTPECVRRWVEEGVVVDRSTGYRVYLEKTRVGGQVFTT